jgi:hypothetical protein
MFEINFLFVSKKIFPESIEPYERSGQLRRSKWFVFEKFFQHNPAKRHVTAAKHSQ